MLPESQEGCDSAHFNFYIGSCCQGKLVVVGLLLCVPVSHASAAYVRIRELQERNTLNFGAIRRPLNRLKRLGTDIYIYIYGSVRRLQCCPCRRLGLMIRWIVRRPASWLTVTRFDDHKVGKLKMASAPAEK